MAAASLLLTACSDDTSRATQDDSPVTPSSGATEGTTDVRPPWKLLSDEPDGVPLTAGAYGLTANGVSDHVVVIRAPKGYQNIGGWTFVSGDPFHAMGFQTADRVPRDPCERLVLAWVAMPGVPRAQTREMTRMVQSAHFVEQ